MGAFILFVENEVSTQSGAPSAVEIESVLRALPVNGNREFKLHRGLPGDAGFVGHARVTRIARVGVPGGRVTRVAWLYMWPDPPGATPAQNAQLYADVVRNVLANTNTYLNNSGIGDSWASTGWKPSVAAPYDPGANGTLLWWESPTGAMATATRDAFDLNQQTGNLSTIDNPIGPTTSHVPDFDPFGTNNPDSAFNKLLGLVPWAVGGLALFYVVGPIVQAVVSAVPRKNPYNRIDDLNMDVFMALEEHEGKSVLTKSKPGKSGGLVITKAVVRYSNSNRALRKDLERLAERNFMLLDVTPDTKSPLHDTIVFTPEHEYRFNPTDIPNYGPEGQAARETAIGEAGGRGRFGVIPSVKRAKGPDAHARLAWYHQNMATHAALNGNKAKAVFHRAQAASHKQKAAA